MATVVYCSVKGVLNHSYIAASQNSSVYMFVFFPKGDKALTEPFLRYSYCH
jgi:hypothetical protein